ncbi:uncharacterized protein LOC143277781 isoform X2 [Babylonia areolata]|uniref:uncharacterized protein LOC143277781 isoform X2 n=1 Tax=Babylonia areolata TaxID=304850 RepID=UPI003FD3764B
MMRTQKTTTTKKKKRRRRRWKPRRSRSNQQREGFGGNTLLKNNASLLSGSSSRNSQTTSTSEVRLWKRRQEQRFSNCLFVCEKCDDGSLTEHHHHHDGHEAHVLRKAGSSQLCCSSCGSSGATTTTTITDEDSRPAHPATTPSRFLLHPTSSATPRPELPHRRERSQVHYHHHHPSTARHEEPETAALQQKKRWKGESFGIVGDERHAADRADTTTSQAGDRAEGEGEAGTAATAAATGGGGRGGEVNDRVHIVSSGWAFSGRYSAGGGAPSTQTGDLAGVANSSPGAWRRSQRKRNPFRCRCSCCLEFPPFPYPLHSSSSPRTVLADPGTGRGRGGVLKRAGSEQYGSPPDSRHSVSEKEQEGRGSSPSHQPPPRKVSRAGPKGSLPQLQDCSVHVWRLPHEVCLSGGLTVSGDPGHHQPLSADSEVAGSSDGPGESPWSAVPSRAAPHPDTPPCTVLLRPLPSSWRHSLSSDSSLKLPPEWWVSVVAVGGARAPSASSSSSSSFSLTLPPPPLPTPSPPPPPPPFSATVKGDHSERQQQQQPSPSSSSSSSSISSSFFSSSHAVSDKHGADATHSAQMSPHYTASPGRGKKRQAADPSTLHQRPAKIYRTASEKLLPKNLALSHQHRHYHHHHHHHQQRQQQRQKHSQGLNPRSDGGSSGEGGTVALDSPNRRSERSVLNVPRTPTATAEAALAARQRSSSPVVVAASSTSTRRRGRPPGTRLTCVLCHSRFSSSSDMQIHLNKHLGKKKEVEEKDKKKKEPLLPLPAGEKEGPSSDSSLETSPPRHATPSTTTNTTTATNTNTNTTNIAAANASSRSGVCHRCGFLAPSPSALARHVTILHPPKPHTCPLCWLTLTSSHTLQRHLRGHRPAGHTSTSSFHHHHHHHPHPHGVRGGKCGRKKKGKKRKRNGVVLSLVLLLT